MAAPNSSASNQDNSDATLWPVVNAIFCLRSHTIFTVWKKGALSSTVAGMVIKDSNDDEKFKMEELPDKEPGLAVQYVGGDPILSVKPEKHKSITKFVRPNGWNVFRTMEGDSTKLFTVQTSSDYKSDYSKIKVILQTSKITVQTSSDYTIQGSKGIFKIFHRVKIEGEPSIAAEVTLIDSVYNVKVMTGYDQAFIFGLVAVFEQIRRTKK